MYKVEVDRAKKLIKFEISGFFKVEDAEALSREMDTALKQFKPKESLILCKLVDFKPVSTAIGPILEKLQAKAASYGKKVATANASIVSETQLKRLGNESKTNDVITRFHTEEEALKYLLG